MTSSGFLVLGRTQHGLLGVALIMVLTVLAYLPAIRGGFIWDDDAHVTQNAALRSLRGLKLIWLTPGATPQYYPLTHTTFWIEYHLWGLNPLGYHLVNVLLHGGAALLVWRVLDRLEVRGAFLAAAIFALHPVHAESVAWISERKNVLSGFFYLLAAAMFLRGVGWASPSSREKRWAMPTLREPAWLALSFVLFLAAMLSKTVAGSLPAALVLVLWWKRRRPTRAQIVTLAAMFIVAIIMGSVTAAMERSVVGASGPEWDYTLTQRVLIAGRAVWFYLRTLLCPVGLMFVYPKWPVDPNRIAPWIFPIALGIALGAVALSRKRLGRAPLVAVLFFVGTLFPALGFVNVYPMRYSFVADHFQYLASIGIIALIGSALARWRRYAIVVPVALGALTWLRAGVLSDARSLWADTLNKNPAAWIAHDHLAEIALEQGDVALAIGHYQTAIQLEPKHIEAYLGMGNLMLRRGEPHEAVAWMRKAVEVQPTKPRPRYMLGVALVQADDPTAAAVEFEKAIALEPNFVWAHDRLAELYERLGQSDKANEQKRAAQRIRLRAFGYDASP